MPAIVGKWALLLGLLFIHGPIPLACAKNENYKMNDVCKNPFLRDLYRKIDGAVITSQNERNLGCAITFQTHSILQRFMLRFDRLQLDCNDHLYIYDGDHEVGNYKVDLSCRSTESSVSTLYTRTNFVTLKYVTDAWGTDTNGFRLVISAIKDPKHACKDFRCTTKEFCIDTDLVCDGIRHCEDGSDEAASTRCANPEASTILGMEKTLFAVAMVFVFLSMVGIVAAGVLCFCRQRTATPRHLHNAHNAQTHPPVIFPCEDPGPGTKEEEEESEAVCHQEDLKPDQETEASENSRRTEEHREEQTNLQDLRRIQRKRGENKPKTAEEQQVKQENKPKTVEEQQIKEENKPKTAEEQRIKQGNKSKTADEQQIKKGNKSKTADEQQIKEGNKPKSAEEQQIKLDDPQRTEYQDRITEAQCHQSYPTTEEGYNKSKTADKQQTNLQYPNPQHTNLPYPNLQHQDRITEEQPDQETKQGNTSERKPRLLKTPQKISWHQYPLSQKVMMLTLSFFLLTTTFLHDVLAQIPDLASLIEKTNQTSRDFLLGPCLVKTNNTCPDPEVQFFLYTKSNPETADQIFLNSTGSNLSQTNFTPSNPTKIIIHGYNSDMQLDSLVDIRNEYLKRSEDYNLIAVDWHRLASGPCYPVAVHNVPHVGSCLAQLINQIREAGAEDIHAIGFSLGAHVPAFAANALRPYKLPRITGLDPAMPLFVTVDNDEKLDKGDAQFVDVFHTNAFIQGKVECVGHIDFYMNGGINQPGCWQKRNPFGCNHHRAAMYFAESVNSEIGFWGWPCPGFFAYLLGLCSPRFPAVLAGDKVNRNYTGFHLVKTKSESPFAEGIFNISARRKRMVPRLGLIESF